MRVSASQIYWRKGEPLFMNSDTTVLYLSHVQWNWIKQRPQYLAAELAKHFEQLIYYQPQVYRDKGLKPNADDGVEIQELSRIPSLRDRIKPFKAFNDWTARKTIAKKLEDCESPLVWLASPATLAWVPDAYSGPLVYDCMDDHGAFASGPAMEEIDALERRLVERADLVLASSTRLVGKMRQMAGTGEKKILLVRNGFDGKILDCDGNNECDCHGSSSFKACYFGTIGPWFDFDLLRISLECIPGLCYKIIGPVDDGVAPLQDPRIEYTGPVAHDSLGDYVVDCDCFVMPFKVNDIVLSVDPVKMYEYINFGKDIVCVRYPEVERFNDYAELYDGASGFCEALGTVMKRGSRKYSGRQRLSLLEESSWSSRVAPILEALGEL